VKLANATKLLLMLQQKKEDLKEQLQERSNNSQLLPQFGSPEEAEQAQSGQSSEHSAEGQTGMKASLGEKHKHRP
jgi:hypothetical protein